MAEEAKTNWMPMVLLVAGLGVLGYFMMKTPTGAGKTQKGQKAQKEQTPKKQQPEA